uniref:Uncharacterized protein n=1 Tax=Oryza rufipogon TaxID=4529 RepID=A0A0E0NP56_ORYRU
PPPSLLPTQKKKKKKTHLLVPFHPHLLLPFRWIPAAVSTSPASPSGVERRRGRWPVRCGVVAGERLLGFAASEAGVLHFGAAVVSAEVRVRRFGRGDWKQSR